MLGINGSTRDSSWEFAPDRVKIGLHAESLELPLAMPLIMQRQQFGREQFKVYDDQRYIGRIYQTPSDDWFWSVDLLLTEGKKSIDGRAAMRAEALAQLRTAWNGCRAHGEVVPVV